MAAGLLCLVLLWLALLPARVGVAMRVRGGSQVARATRALAGALVDLDAVLWPTCALIAVLSLLTLVVPRLARSRTWQGLGPSLLVLWPGALWLVISTIEQEVKAERGAYPTVEELLRSGLNASFMQGLVDFVHYERMWLPTSVCLTLGLGVLFVGWRWASRTEVVTPGAWWLGLGLSFLGGAGVMSAAVAGQARVSARLSPGGLSAPLAALLESGRDLVSGRVPGKPGAVLQRLHFTQAESDVGAARLGWPPAAQAAPGRPHPHARALEGEASRAQALLAALRELSGLLFRPPDQRLAVFVFSLESFRGDDLHALHATAPRHLTPFVNSLYEAAGRGQPGVLVSRRFWQAGVRTAQGLAAMTCGLGTLPFNLSLIRDFDAFPMRCAPDVLHDAGFQGHFFYGSDATYDGMATFARGHGLADVISQDELPQTAPRGAWHGVTDLALFDAAQARMKAALDETSVPQLAWVMSLSNHSPFTRPEDAPATLDQRVEEALNHAPNRATPDDKLRLLTHTYADFALERFFASLDETGLAEHALVVLVADHSTGDDYVWGNAEHDHETDEAKAQLPFVVVVPPAFLARVGASPGLSTAWHSAQAQLDAVALSQNDLPMLLLALLSGHAGVTQLGAASRWHTLGGQATSPWFSAGGDDDAEILGINGVDELYALRPNGERTAPYEDAVMLQTEGDAARVTPRLGPAAATVLETLNGATLQVP